MATGSGASSRRTGLRPLAGSAHRGCLTLHLTSPCLSGLSFAGRVVSPLLAPLRAGSQPGPALAHCSQVGRTGQDRCSHASPYSWYSLCYCLLGGDPAPGPPAKPSAPPPRPPSPPGLPRARGSQTQSTWAPGAWEVRSPVLGFLQQSKSRTRDLGRGGQGCTCAQPANRPLGLSFPTCKKLPRGV